MKSSLLSFVGIVVLIGAAGAAYYFYFNKGNEAPPPQPMQTVRHAPSPVPHPAPENHFAVPGEGQVTASSEPTHFGPMPTLDTSDDSIEQALSDLIGKERFKALFMTDNLVRRVVATVDNTTASHQITSEFSALKPLESNFRVSKHKGLITIATANYDRYEPYVDLIRRLDVKRASAVYVHFYPLFQVAYNDLGVQGYFNDRLVQVIDHLLSTPNVKGSIAVTQLTASFEIQVRRRKTRGTFSRTKNPRPHGHHQCPNCESEAQGSARDAHPSEEISDVAPVSSLNGHSISGIDSVENVESTSGLTSASRSLLNGDRGRRFLRLSYFLDFLFRHGNRNPKSWRDPADRHSAPRRTIGRSTSYEISSLFSDNSRDI